MGSNDNLYDDGAAPKSRTRTVYTQASNKEVLNAFSSGYRFATLGVSHEQALLAFRKEGKVHFKTSACCGSYVLQHVYDFEYCYSCQQRVEDGVQ